GTHVCDECALGNELGEHRRVEDMAIPQPRRFPWPHEPTLETGPGQEVDVSGGSVHTCPEQRPSRVGHNLRAVVGLTRRRVGAMGRCRRVDLRVSARHRPPPAFAHVSRETRRAVPPDENPSRPAHTGLTTTYLRGSSPSDSLTSPASATASSPTFRANGVTAPSDSGSSEARTASLTRLARSTSSALRRAR